MKCIAMRSTGVGSSKHNIPCGVFGGQSGTEFRFRTNVFGAISIFQTDRDRTLPLGVGRVGSAESFPACNKAVVK